MKKVLALALAGIMSLSVVACGSGSSGSSAPASSGSESSSQEAAAETITNTTEVAAVEADENRASTKNSDGQAEKVVVALAADPQDLSPWNPNSGSKPYMYFEIYETLFDDKAGEYIPIIAESYEIVDDLHWDVKIRENVFDSAGNQIKASDVVYSYYVQYDGGYLVRYNMFESIEEVDEFTVRFTWNKPIDGVDELNWPFCTTLVFSQAAYEDPNANFATAPIGTGPYVVKSFTAGSGLVLEANDNYWWDEAVNGPTPTGHKRNVKTIEYQVMTETSQQVIALQNKTIDFSYSISSDYFDDFNNDPDYTLFRAPAASTYILSGNLASPVTSDTNFRLACFYAIDSEQVAKAANLGATTSMGSPYFEVVNYYDGIENYHNKVDLDLAKEYLGQSSYNGETVYILTESADVYKNAGTMVVAMLAQIGVNAELKAVEAVQASNMLNETEGWDFSLAHIGGGTYIGGMNRVLNVGDFADGGSYGHNFDDTLHELYAKCAKTEGHTEENLVELMNYVCDNAYLYAWGYGFNSYVYSNDNMAELGFDISGRTVKFGDCEYYLD